MEHSDFLNRHGFSPRRVQDCSYSHFGAQRRAPLQQSHRGGGNARQIRTCKHLPSKVNCLHFEIVIGKSAPVIEWRSSALSERRPHGLPRNQAFRNAFDKFRQPGRSSSGVPRVVRPRKEGVPSTTAERPSAALPQSATVKSPGEM